MGHKGLAKFSKYSLIVANIIIEVFGVLAIVAGLIALFGLGQIPPIIFVLLFVGGSIIVVVGLLGYMGAHQENSLLLKIYGGIMIALLVCKLAVVAITTIHNGHPLIGFPKQTEIAKAYFYYGQNPAITSSVDKLQQELSCCGYYKPVSMMRPDGTYPSSCCFLQEKECRHPFLDGCSSRIESTVIIVVWSVFAITLVVHILLATMAFYFALVIQRKTDAQQLQSTHKYGNF